MDHKQNKLENPVRLAELKPEETLKKIGLDEHAVVCDIGAGSGIFTIPAAKMTDNSVIALEINDEFLGIINEKANKEKLHNIKTVKVAGDHFNVESGTVDFAILVTVLHEIEDKDAFLAELKRIIKHSGKLSIIEFHKRQTPMGPPVEHRIGRDETAAMCSRYGFSLFDEFDLGDNFYCVVLKS